MIISPSHMGTDYVANFTSCAHCPSTPPGTQIPQIPTAIAQTSGFSQNLLCCVPAAVTLMGLSSTCLLLYLSPLEAILWVI